MFFKEGRYMIFVTVGTQKFPFDRLLKMVDIAVGTNGFPDSVYAQIGTGKYVPHNYGYTDFCSNDIFVKMIEDCDLIITHSGVGTIMKGLEKNKPVIVVPRLAKYGEHVDDHQVQLARSFAEKNYVFMYNEGDSISDLVKKAKIHRFERYFSQRDKLIKVLDDFINSI